MNKIDIMIEEQLRAELNSELDRLAYKRSNTKRITALTDYINELKKYLDQYPDTLYQKYSEELSPERFKKIFIEVTNSRNSEIGIG